MYDVILLQWPWEVVSYYNNIRDLLIDATGYEIQ